MVVVVISFDELQANHHNKSQNNEWNLERKHFLEIVQMGSLLKFTVKLIAHCKYCRVLNITRVPNKSIIGNFFLKSNKTGGDLINKKFRGRWEKHPKNNKISSCFIWSSRVAILHIEWPKNQWKPDKITKRIKTYLINYR